MTLPQTIGIKAVLIAVGCAILVGLGGFFVLNIMGYRLGKAQQATETATDGAVAVRQEQAGQAALQGREDTLRIVVDQAQGAAREFATEAQRAPDAHVPVAPERLARLRAADEQLCDYRPAICEGRGDSGPAAADAAEAGDGAL